MSVEARLCDLFGYRRAVLFGRARSGIVAVLQALGAKTLVGPSNCCPAVVYAAVAAGADYRMVAPNPTANVADPVPMVWFNCDGPAVVMPTHLYGEHMKFKLIGDAFVLENDTLAVTASRNPAKQPIGDALLVSFASGKTIDACVGGAVLTDDTELAVDLLRFANRMPIFEDNDRVFDERLAASSRQDRAASERLIKQAVDAATRTLEEWHIEPIAEALDARIPKIEAAGQRWQWWYDALRPRDLRAAGCIVLNPDVPWRFTMLIDQPYRDAIVQALRAAGFDAGTNYPNLARSFPKLLGDQRHADADSWAARVMQLWLTDDYDQARIRRGADIVRQAVDQLFAAKKGSPT